MADTKITALDAIGANPINVATFPIPMVDLLDNSMAASGTTKKVTVNQILGAGGTATLASATITGDLTVDTSTLKVDSTNNRVTVGTTSAYGRLTVGVGSGLQAGTTTNVASGLYDIDYATTGDINTRFSFVNSNGVTNAAIDRIGNPNVTDSGNLAFLTRSGAGSLTERYRIASDGVATWSNVGGVAGTAMTLNANGLGIGVTPSAQLASYKSFQFGIGGNLIGRSDNSGIELSSNSYRNSGGNYIYLNTATAASYRQYSGGHEWHNAPSGTAGTAITFTQAMTLDASGNLLVGTTTMPSGVTLARLVAKSDLSDWSGVIWNSNAIPYGFRIQHDTDSNGTGNEFLYCLGAANLRASIRSNGGIANYQANDVSLSDSRMKSDIKPLGSYWNKIKSLEIVTFKYKDQTHNDDNIGLIAQQVESVAPEFVDVDGFGNTPDDGVPLKTIYTTDLYHAAIKALQEAMTRIEVLESKLA